MHQNRLAASRRQGIAAGHVHGDDLMRAQDHFGMLAAFLVPARQLLDQGDVIGTQIGKDVVHPEVDQTFEEMVRGRVTAHALRLPWQRLRDKPVAKRTDAGDFDLDDVAGLQVG